MSEEEKVEEVAEVAEEVSAPGRKPGKMKRDEKGRLLKKDGTLAKPVGRKKSKTTKTAEKKPGKRGRPKGTAKKTEAKKPGKRGRPKSTTTKKKVTKGKRGRPAGSTNKNRTTTSVQMPKGLKEAILEFSIASKNLTKMLSKVTS